MLEGPLHEHHLLRYHVEIEDKHIHSCDKTALVTFFDENNKKVRLHRFGLITNTTIYNLIDKGEKLDLDNKYVKDFSLSEYRLQKGLKDHSYIQLSNFSAKNSFFDCDEKNDFSYAEFIGEKTVFDSAIFGNGNIDFFNANFGHGDVSFKKVKFGGGDTSFQSVKFGDGSVSFHNTNFGTGDLNFSDANFSNGNVDFSDAYFGDGNINFKFARFASGDISFERANFGNGKKDFKNVEFGGGRIDFRRASFNDGDVSFEGVEFGDGKVTFRGSTFGSGYKSFEEADFAKGEALFDLVNFGSGTVSFKKTRVSEISFKGCALNCYMDLRLGQCNLADLSNTIVRDIVDVKPEGEKVVIKEMKLVDMRILGRIFIDWRGNEVGKLIYNQQRTSLFQKTEQFRILKENFRNNGQYEDEDAAYLEFKRCESKAYLENAILKNKSNVVWAYPQYFFQKYMFDYIGRYATAPVRVLANAFLAVTFYGIIYYLATNWFPDFGTVASTLPADLNHFSEFWNCMYYSSITFFTVGYGDYFASGGLKFFAVFEGFSGVFLMSYFTVAFVRKILR